jgi:hypothetical protein
VAGSADEGNAADLSININQAEALAGTVPPIDTYTPTGTGIAYSIANKGGSVRRLQILCDEVVGLWTRRIQSEATLSTLLAPGSTAGDARKWV